VLRLSRVVVAQASAMPTSAVAVARTAAYQLAGPQTCGCVALVGMLCNAGPVKLRRGLTASVFDRCSNMHDLYSWFLTFLEVLEHKVRFQCT